MLDTCSAAKHLFAICRSFEGPAALPLTSTTRPDSRWSFVVVGYDARSTTRPTTMFVPTDRVQRVIVYILSRYRAPTTPGCVLDAEMGWRHPLYLWPSIVVPNLQTYQGHSDVTPISLLHYLNVSRPRFHKHGFSQSRRHVFLFVHVERVLYVRYTVFRSSCNPKSLGIIPGADYLAAGGGIRPPFYPETRPFLIDCQRQSDAFLGFSFPRRTPCLAAREPHLAKLIFGWEAIPTLQQSLQIIVRQHIMLRSNPVN